MAETFSPSDGYPTETYELQRETEDVLLKHLPSADKDQVVSLKLNRNAHMEFLARNLIQGFPARYTSQDASQPWLMFWTLQAFSALQVGIDPGNKQRAIDTILKWQHPNGGFGGGPGQSPHLLPTYASVCALAIVGRPGPCGGWDQIDREKMYRFFMSLKQPDGSFLVTYHAEVDVRGIYCLLVVAHLLDLLTPELLDGVPGFIASCQTYEGGCSSTSQPYYSGIPSPETLLAFPRPPLGEAHGGYTFCALASWLMLRPYLKLGLERPLSSTLELKIKTLRRWLVQMQGNERELGGFKGRTNKLVDGCYSWWVGGAFSLLTAVEGDYHDSAFTTSEGTNAGASENADWSDIDDAILNRDALQEYILLAGQHPAGGLRDKPFKGADAYHTLYCLSGLSSAQHTVTLSSTRREQLSKSWKDPEDASNLELRKAAFVESLSWNEEIGQSRIVGGSDNRLNATHPVFNLTITHTDAMMAHFYRQSETLPARTSPK